MKGLRKRFLVSEGDFFQLYKEIEQVRNQEQREAFYKRFKALLKDAQEVIITPKSQKNAK